MIPTLTPEDRMRIAQTAPFTIRDMVLAQAGEERPGLLFEGQTFSHAEVVAEATRRAHLLLAERPEGPLRVGVLLDNVPDFAFWLAAGALAGAAIVPFNPTRRGAELEGDIAHMECQFVVTEGRYRELLDGFDEIVPADRIHDVEDPAYQERVAAQPGDAVPDVEVGSSTPFLYVFTSGTTGAPKACRVSHGRLAVNAKVLAALHELGPDDVLYESMPFFHSSILNSCWASGWAAGACHAMRRRFSASSFLGDVREMGATYFGYVGKPLAYILATPERPDDADNPLRRGQGNEASPLDVARFSERFGCSIRDGYGSTEGCVTIARTPDAPFGALGRAYHPSTMVIDPETGQECPPARFDDAGQLLNAKEATGEIVDTNGGNTFEGYYNNAEAESTRIRDGWYWSGDLAYRDADGWFYFAGRNGDMIRVDGENLSTAVVERLLERERNVVAVGAYALPAPVGGGDDLMACFQLRGGVEFDPVSFVQFLDDQQDLGPKMRPLYVRVTDQLPLGPSQKIDRRTLRQEGLDTTDPVWARTPDGTYARLDVDMLTSTSTSKLTGQGDTP